MPDPPTNINKAPTSFTLGAQSIAGAIWENPQMNKFVILFKFFSVLWWKLLWAKNQASALPLSSHFLFGCLRETIPVLTLACELASVPVEGSGSPVSKMTRAASDPNLMSLQNWKMEIQ